MWKLLNLRNKEFAKNCIVENRLYICTGLVLGLFKSSVSGDFSVVLVKSLAADQYIAVLFLLTLTFSCFRAVVIEFKPNFRFPNILGDVNEELRALIRTFFGVLAGFIITFSIFGSFNIGLCLIVLFIELALFFTYLIASEITNAIELMNTSDPDKLQGTVFSVLFLTIYIPSLYFSQSIIKYLGNL